MCDADRQSQRRRRQNAQMHECSLGHGERARKQMRVGIADQQCGLEEHHRYRPHGRRSAEARQHHFGEHRLHGKQQQRGREQGHGEQRWGDA
jgi:hypothetical protein